MPEKEIHWTPLAWTLDAPSTPLTRHWTPSYLLQLDTGRPFYSLNSTLQAICLDAPSTRRGHVLADLIWLWVGVPRASSALVVPFPRIQNICVNPSRNDPISQRVFLTSFCKSQFPHKSVDLFFIFAIVEGGQVDGFVGELTSTERLSRRFV